LKALKIFLLLCTAGLIPFEGNSQQILNGGFEETISDTSSYYPQGYLRPLYWGFGWYTLGCGYIMGEMTDESHSGNWAIKLETISCAPAVVSSVAATRQEVENSIFLPELSSHIINDRPDQLSFYFKYQPVNGDTARVSALLFNYPDTVFTNQWEIDWFEVIDTVAFVQVLLVGSTAQYTQHVVNFEYFSSEVPSYCHVDFFSNHHGGEFYGGQHAHPGTTLWIDDVELIYLPTSSEYQLSTPDIRIFPNPVVSHFQMDVPDKTQIQSVVVFDNYGREMRTLNPQDRFHPMNNLAPGIYFVRIETEKGSVVKKLVKE